MAMYILGMNRTDDGKFTQKFDGDPKVLRSIRLTDTAWSKLQETASKLCLTRTDFIELFVRNYRTDEEIILTAIDQYINSQLTQSGGNQHRKKGESLNIENSRDWKKLRQFRKWIENQNND